MSNQHTMDLFLKVSCFTRHLLDDALPVVVGNHQSVESDIIQKLIEECDTLVFSLQKFKQLASSKVLQSHETLTNGLSTCSVKGTDQIHYKFIELCELVRKNIKTVRDVIKFKPYYCKICNLATTHESLFNHHSSSVKHLEFGSKSFELVTVYKCKVCHLFLIAPQSEINTIISLMEHFQLDEHILNLKDALKKNKLNNSQSNIGLDKVAICNIVENTGKIDSDQFIIPQKVVQLFQIMIKKLNFDLSLSDTVPHYCNVCDVMAYSVSKFIEHNSSKEHISIVNIATKPINVFKCDICGFLITGNQLIIDGIINSKDHKSIDKCIKTSIQPKASILKNESASGTVVKTQVNTKEMSEFKYFPESLKKLINIYLERIKLSTDLKKYAPGHCFLCNKTFNCMNDFQQHLQSKKHNISTKLTSVSLHLHYCSVCLISLCGIESDLNNVLESSEHINVHQRIDFFFKCKTDTKSNSKLNDTSDQTSSSSDKEKLELLNEKQTESKRSSVTLFNNVTIDSSDNNNKRLVKSLEQQSVPDKFFALNSKLLCDNFSKSGFCRPCKRAVNITKGWSSHLSCSKHKKVTETTPFEKIPLSCKYCPLQILGDQLYGNHCMDVHVKINHPIKKKVEIQNNEVKNLPFLDMASGISHVKNNICKQLEFNDNLISNSLQSVAQTKQIYEVKVNKELLPQNLGNQYYQEDSIQISPVEVSHNLSTETKTNSLDIFLTFLKKKKACFINEGLKQFGGMCILCNETFEDYYEWLIHLKEPSHKSINNLDTVERECVKCNLSLFGERSTINNDYWSVEEHVLLDALITQ